MLPGVKPTGKDVEIPLVAIVCFRGDKLYNEHIYWDQASVLVQIGVNCWTKPCHPMSSWRNGHKVKTPKCFHCRLHSNAIAQWL